MKSIAITEAQARAAGMIKDPAQRCLLYDAIVALGMGEEADESSMPDMVRMLYVMIRDDMAKKIKRRRSKVSTSACNLQTSACNVQTSACNLQTSACNLQTNVDNVQTSACNLQTNVDNVQTSACNVQTSACNLQTSARNVQTNVDNVQTSACNLQTSACNVQTNVDTVLSSSPRPLSSISAQLSTIAGAHAHEPVGVRYPESPEEVLKYCHEVLCMVISPEQAQKYFLERDASNWRDKNCNVILPKKLGSDLRRWMMREHQREHPPGRDLHGI